VIKKPHPWGLTTALFDQIKVVPGSLERDQPIGLNWVVSIGLNGGWAFGCEGHGRSPLNSIDLAS
jgi:hypothetical protein